MESEREVRCDNIRDTTINTQLTATCRQGKAEATWLCLDKTAHLKGAVHARLRQPRRQVNRTRRIFCEGSPSGAQLGWAPAPPPDVLSSSASRAARCASLRRFRSPAMPFCSMNSTKA